MILKYHVTVLPKNLVQMFYFPNISETHRNIRDRYLEKSACTILCFWTFIYPDISIHILFYQVSKRGNLFMFLFIALTILTINDSICQHHYTGL